MIHIFYRHYSVSHREEWRPHWFDYEKCYDNLLRTIHNPNNVRINIVFDGDTDNFIRNKKFDNFFNINAGNDLDSFNQTLKIVKDLSESFDLNDIIYFLENDYLHMNGWDLIVQDFFSSRFKSNYLTLYDHYDKYHSQNLSEIIVTDKHHFRTTPSTCGSYLSNVETFLKDFTFHTSIFEFLKNKTSYPLDHAKFLTLQKITTSKLFSPIPGLSTHCLNNLMSPTIDWGKLI